MNTTSPEAAQCEDRCLTRAFISSNLHISAVIA